MISATLVAEKIDKFVIGVEPTSLAHIGDH